MAFADIVLVSSGSSFDINLSTSANSLISGTTSGVCSPANSGTLVGKGALAGVSNGSCTPANSGTLSGGAVTEYISGTIGQTLTDNFQAYTTGALNGQGNWLNNSVSANSMYIGDTAGDKRFYSYGSSTENCVRRSEPFNANQFAQCTLDATPNDPTGVSLRCSYTGGVYYHFGYYCREYSREVFYSVNGSYTELGGSGGPGVSAGDVLRIELTGNILKVYLNGVIDTVLSGGGIYDVSSVISSYPALGSGAVGVTGFDNDTVGCGDDWTAGEIGCWVSGTLTAKGSLHGATGIGASLLDSGKGDFTTDTEGFVAYGSNTIALENGALRVNYVDNNQGAYNYLNAAGDLTTDLTVGLAYRIVGKIKVNTGGVWFMAYRSGMKGQVWVANTEYAWKSLSFVCDDTVNTDVGFGDFESGEIIWLDKYSISQIIGATVSGTLTPKAYLSGTIFQTITDNFNSYTTGDLDDQGLWRKVEVPQINVLDDSGNRVVYAGTAGDSGYAYNRSVNPNQWAQITVGSSVTNDYIGITLRCGTDDSEEFYKAIFNSGYGTMERNYYGDYVGLDSYGSGIVTGDVIRFEIWGNQLKCYLNDVLVMDATDSNFTTGRIGIAAYRDTGGTYGDNWIGGELVSWVSGILGEAGGTQYIAGVSNGVSEVSLVAPHHLRGEISPWKHDYFTDYRGGGQIDTQSDYWDLARGYIESVQSPTYGFGIVIANYDSYHSGIYWIGSFHADQWAEGEFRGIGTQDDRGIGVAVRASSGNYYGLYFNDDYWYLGKCISNAWTQIDTGSHSVSTGDRIRLEIHGSTLRMFKNDVQFDTDQTDTDLTSGAPGICGFDFAYDDALTYWKGEDFLIHGTLTGKGTLVGISGLSSKVTDDFSFDANPIWNNANWNQGIGTVVSDDTWYGGSAFGNSNNPGSLAYYDGIFSPNQYAQTTVAHRENDDYFFGSAVRVSLNNGYCFGVDTNGYRLWKVVSSSYSLITSGALTVSDDDVLRLEIIGTILRMYVNGVQLGSDQTDSDLSSGSPGIGGIGWDSYTCNDDFEGGNVLVSGILAGIAGGGIAGVTNGVADVSGNLTIKLAGVTNGVATISGTLVGDGSLVVVSNGVASCSGILVGTGSLAGIINGIASCSALPVQLSMSGHSNGVTLVSGICQVNSIGSSSGVATCSGTLAGHCHPVGVVNGVATVSGVLHGHCYPVGVSNGVASVSGVLHGHCYLAGVSNGVASCSGILVGEGKLYGTINGVATCSATLIGHCYPAGVINGVATVSGRIIAPGFGLFGEVDGIATVSGTMFFRLHASSNGVASCSGNLVGHGILKGQTGVGSNLLDSGKGKFDSGVDAWIPYTGSSNLVENDGAGALRITYVDSANGGMTYLRAIGDLSTDLTIGRTYRVWCRCKVNDGSSVVPRISNPVTNIGTVNTTTYTWYKNSFVAAATSNSFLYTVSMGAGEIIYIDEWYLMQVVGSVVSGVLNGRTQKVGASNGVAAVSGLLRAEGKLYGTINGIASVSGILVGEGILSGTTAGINVTSGILGGTGALAGLMGGVTVTAAELIGWGILSGEISGIALLEGDLSERLPGKCDGIISSIALVGGTLGGWADLVGVSEGATTVSCLWTPLFIGEELSKISLITTELSEQSLITTDVVWKSLITPEIGDELGIDDFLKIYNKLLFLGNYADISGGRMPNTFDWDYLTVSGALGNETYECPNEPEYISADMDNLWFDSGDTTREVSTSELVGIDYERTFVEYNNISPYAITRIGLAKELSTFTNAEINILHECFQLWIFWTGVLNAYGRLKENRII